ncbi:MAG: folate-binding protein [Burkholderiaceae bacterium]
MTVRSTDIGTLAAGSVALLPHWGCIDARGPEAESFLQSQLTSDVAAIGPDGVGIGGYCTPKGRLLANFLIVRHADGFRLLTGRDVQAGAAKRLSMYVLRARLRIHDHGEDFGMLGAYGEAAPAALAELGFEAPAAHRTVWRDETCLLGLPPVMAAGRSIDRWLLAAPADRIAQAADRLGQRLAPVSADVDRWLEVLSGVPRITDATREAYVPQMINYEVIDGVGFRKGCYPGQEIVARTQYLGKLKRRMFAASLANRPTDEAAWAPGAPVVADEAEVGSVVLSAPAPEGGVALLVEYRMQAASDAVLRVAGEPLVAAELPYVVPDTATPAE